MAAINSPKKVWITDPDLIGTYIRISNLYLWIHLREGQEDLQYKIDGRRLWEQLRKIKVGTTIPVGDLDMTCDRIGNDMYLFIEPAEETRAGREIDAFFDFKIEVPLEDFKNALCTFLKL